MKINHPENLPIFPIIENLVRNYIIDNQETLIQNPSLCLRYLELLAATDNVEYIGDKDFAVKEQQRQQQQQQQQDNLAEQITNKIMSLREQARKEIQQQQLSKQQELLAKQRKLQAIEQMQQLQQLQKLQQNRGDQDYNIVAEPVRNTVTIPADDNPVLTEDDIGTDINNKNQNQNYQGNQKYNFAANTGAKINLDPRNIPRGKEHLAYRQPAAKQYTPSRQDFQQPYTIPNNKMVENSYDDQTNQAVETTEYTGNQIFGTNDNEQNGILPSRKADYSASPIGQSTEQYIVQPIDGNYLQQPMQSINHQQQYQQPINPEILDLQGNQQYQQLQDYSFNLYQDYSGIYPNTTR